MARKVMLVNQVASIAMAMALSAGAGIGLTAPVPKLPKPKRIHERHQGAKEKARRLKQLARLKAI